MCLVRPALLYFSVHVLNVFYEQITYYYYYFFLVHRFISPEVFTKIRSLVFT